MERILAIDDCRELGCAHVLCRTYSDGEKALRLMGPWDVLYLDHDLGSMGIERTETGKELTGYSIMEFLENNPQYLPKKIVVVSDNPVGRKKIEVVIERLCKNKEKT